MKIRIEDIPENGLQLNFSGTEDILSEALESIAVPTGTAIDPRIKGAVGVVKNPKSVSIVGEVDASVRLECARCLSIVQTEKHIGLNLKAGLPGTEEGPRDGYDEPDENGFILEGAVVDIGEIIVQELLLGIPMKPLCREDCPGLCPQCGALKSAGECSCRPEPTIDPRWKALALLKKNESDS